MTRMDWIRSRLSSKTIPYIAVVAALLLTLPSLWVGWQIDDYFHRIMLLGLPALDLPPKPITTLFEFVDGNPEHVWETVDSGIMPWWTYKELHLAFWRPLSSLSHWLDYQLWPDSAVLMHIHNWVWFVALVLIAGMMYRRFLGATWAAGLAALLFAFEDNHALPASWIANRNALLSGFFSLLTLYLHDRWRRDQWKPGIMLAPAAFLTALFCGEAAVGIAGYLFAHVLFLDPRRDWKRGWVLLPYIAVGVCWFAAYRALGYGVAGSEPYNDPAGDPLRFVGLVLQRYPLYLMGQLGFPPADVCSLVTLPLFRVITIWAPLLLAFLAVLFWPLLRRERTARFLAVGMLLAALPLCSVFPIDRVLMLVGFGGIGLIGMFITGVCDNAAGLTATTLRRRTAQVAAFLLFCVHGVLAPLSLPLSSHMPAVLGNYVKNTIATIPADADLTGKQLIVVNTDAFFSSYISLLRALDGLSHPQRMRLLAPAGQGIEIERTDEHTLRMRSKIGFLPPPGTPVDPTKPFAFGFDTVHQRMNCLFRGPEHPLKTGDRIRLTGMEVEIAAADDTRGPTEVLFHFAVPLEDPSLYWIEYVAPKGEPARYERFTPPAVGETVRVQ